MGGTAGRDLVDVRGRRRSVSGRRPGPVPRMAVVGARAGPRCPAGSAVDGTVTRAAARGHRPRVTTRRRAPAHRSPAEVPRQRLQRTRHGHQRIGHRSKRPASPAPAHPTTGAQRVGHRPKHAAPSTPPHGRQRVRDRRDHRDHRRRDLRGGRGHRARRRHPRRQPPVSRRRTPARPPHPGRPATGATTGVTDRVGEDARRVRDRSEHGRRGRSPATARVRGRGRQQDRDGAASSPAPTASSARSSQVLPDTPCTVIGALPRRRASHDAMHTVATSNRGTQVHPFGRPRQNPWASRK